MPLARPQVETATTAVPSTASGVGTAAVTMPPAAYRVATAASETATRSTAAPRAETAIQREIRRQQEWLLENLPSSEMLRQDVIYALNTLRAPEKPRESTFKERLLAWAPSLWTPCLKPANGQGTNIAIIFRTTELSLKDITLDGGGTRFEDTAFFKAWSSARDSAKAILAGRPPSRARARSQTSAMQPQPENNTPVASDNSRVVDTVNSTRTPKSSLNFGPFCPDAALAVSVPSSRIHAQPRRFALMNIFELKMFALRAGSSENAKIDGEEGRVERRDRYDQQRHALTQCMAYCLAHRQMGGSGLGIAIAGESFSRMWAISPNRLVVEVSADAWHAVHARTATMTDLFPAGLLRPVLAHSFLNGVSWDAEEEIEDVDMNAVGRFRNFCLVGISWISRINGPNGPVAIPADTASSPFNTDGLTVDFSSAAETFRMYQILRGERVGDPPAPLESEAASPVDAAQLAPGDSISNAGVDEDGSVGEALLSGMAAGTYTVHTVRQL